MFREVAYSRESGSDPRLARFHISQAVSRADDDLMARLEAAEAHFSGDTREAVLAHRGELEEAYR